MSFYPFYLECERPRQQRLAEQLGLSPQNLLTILAMPRRHQHNTLIPSRNLGASQDIASTIREDKDKFQVNLDVQHFAPEEISVKTVDGYLVVDAKHEEREDEHGFISRSFSRRYLLPEGIEADSVISRLSSDGVLTITAPLKAPPKGSNERIVPIVQTGPVKKQVEGSEEQG